MALNRTNLNLAENEQRVLQAGRIPYESFKVSDWAPPIPPPHHLNGLSGFALVNICFPFLGVFFFFRTQSSQCLA